MFNFASKSSHLFAPVNGATSFFVHCSAFFRSLGESENDRASAYADNFAESDITTLRKLAELPTCSPAALALYYREEGNTYPCKYDDPRYVTIDEIIKNIMKGE